MLNSIFRFCPQPDHAGVLEVDDNVWNNRGVRSVVAELVVKALGAKPVAMKATQDYFMKEGSLSNLVRKNYYYYVSRI